MTGLWKILHLQKLCEIAGLSESGRRCRLRHGYRRNGNSRHGSSLQGGRLTGIGGFVISLGNGQIALGDCLDVMRSVPSGSVDLVLTDPPYTMTKTGNSCRPNYMPDGQILSGVITPVQLWMNECFRVLKTGHFYTFVNKNDLCEYLNSAEKAGFRLHNIITMIKNTKMPNRWYLKYSELVLFFFKGKAKPINNLTSRDYELVEMPQLFNGKLHPTQKPLTFVEKLMLNSSVTGDTILDPFLGSGTTAIAAENTGRRWIGIERDPGYFGAACDRIARHQVRSE